MILGGVTSATYLGGLNFERNPCISQLHSNAFNYSERKKEQHFPLTPPLFLFEINLSLGSHFWERCVLGIKFQVRQGDPFGPACEESKDGWGVVYIPQLPWKGL